MCIPLSNGTRIAQLNQSCNQDIKTKRDCGNFPTLEAAQTKAKEVSKGSDEDSVIIKNKNGTFQVYGISEVGNFDPKANKLSYADNKRITQYALESVNENVESFFITKRDEKGWRVGKEGEEAELKINKGSADATFELEFSIENLPYELEKCNEDDLLKLTDNKGTIFPVGQINPALKPIILVHGIDDDFAKLQPLINKLRDEKYPRQILVYAYDDKGKSPADTGKEFASELNRIRKDFNWKDVDIVAHSMGGIVSKRALNELKEGESDQKHLNDFNKINLITIDTPWEGFFPHLGSAPPEIFPRSGMNAYNELFTGSEDAKTDAVKKGLRGVELPPDKVEMHMIVANNGEKPDLMWDYTDMISNLKDETLSKYTEQMVIAGDRKLPDAKREKAKTEMYNILEKELGNKAQQYQNGFLPIMQDSSWEKISNDLKPLTEKDKLPKKENGDTTFLNSDTMIDILKTYIPRIAGTHNSILQNKELLDNVFNRVNNIK